MKTRLLPSVGLCLVLVGCGPSSPTAPTRSGASDLCVLTGRVVAGDPITTGATSVAKGTPVPGVSVAITSATFQISTQTDGDGRYRAELNPGACTVRASKDAFETVERSLTVTAATVCNLELRRLPGGTLTDLQAAADIIAWNMTAEGGGSYRRKDLICRWELPVPVYLQYGPEDPDRRRAIEALDYWQTVTGLTYTLIAADVPPRLLIRPGTDGLAEWGGGRALIDGTYSNNRARSGLVVFEPGGGRFCRTPDVLCRYLFRHEIGHTLGIFVNTGDVGVMGSGSEVSPRERNMMAALYALPLGTRVDADGTWQVIMQ